MSKNLEDPMNRFTHFELATNDLEKTAAFYRDVFGWKIAKWDRPADYWLITTGDATTPGLNGGLMPAAEGFPAGTVNTIEVDDIDAAIARVKAHGGMMVFEKDVIPGVGYQAYFRDTTGIIVGLHQGDETAGL
jgi:predicted enzyme related to lactoylglutathione lyase